MERDISIKQRSTSILRWTARIWSVVSILILIGFVIGEGIHPSTRWEGIGLVFFPLGVSIGMVISWRREGMGGIITISSLVIYYIIFYASAGHWPPGVAWVVFAAPGFLFLWCWWRGMFSQKSELNANKIKLNP